MYHLRLVSHSTIQLSFANTTQLLNYAFDLRDNNEGRADSMNKLFDCFSFRQSNRCNNYKKYMDFSLSAFGIELTCIYIKQLDVMHIILLTDRMEIIFKIEFKVIVLKSESIWNVKVHSFWRIVINFIFHIIRALPTFMCTNMNMLHLK